MTFLSRRWRFYLVDDDFPIYFNAFIKAVYNWINKDSYALIFLDYFFENILYKKI